MSFALYLVGYVILIAGLAYGAYDARPTTLDHRGSGGSSRPRDSHWGGTDQAARPSRKMRARMRHPRESSAGGTATLSAAKANVEQRLMAELPQRG